MSRHERRRYSPMVRRHIDGHAAHGPGGPRDDTSIDEGVMAPQLVLVEDPRDELQEAVERFEGVHASKAGSVKVAPGPILTREQVARLRPCCRARIAELYGIAHRLNLPYGWTCECDSKWRIEYRMRARRR